MRTGKEPLTHADPRGPGLRHVLGKKHLAGRPTEK